MALPQSNYTQYPNEILDNLPLLSGSELKVISAICRHTIGFHQAKKRMSISFLMEATGLSNKGVILACDSLVERDWVEKFSSKKGSEFSLKLECPEVVKKVHNQVEMPMNSVHNTCEKSSQPPVNSVHTNKEIKETTKVSLNQPNGAAMLTPAPENLPTPPEEQFGLIAKLVDLGVSLNNGLKSRILKTPPSVVKVSIADLQAGINKGNVDPSNYARYLNGRITKNLELYQSLQHPNSGREETQVEVEYLPPPQPESVTSPHNLAGKIWKMEVTLRSGQKGVTEMRSCTEADIPLLSSGELVWFGLNDGTVRPYIFRETMQDEEAGELLICGECCLPESGKVDLVAVYMDNLFLMHKRDKQAIQTLMQKDKDLHPQRV